MRLRAIAVVPIESATIKAVGGDVQISNAYVSELDFTYFFTKKGAAELILATTKHDVKAISTAVGDIELGPVWLLPPTLTLQYHFDGEVVSPYLGTEVKCTLFYNIDNGPVAEEVSYDNSLGFDIDLNDTRFINLDANYLLLNITATVNATTASGLQLMQM